MSGISQDKHTAILDAAYTLFGSKGFYETKISEVADLAGIAKGTVYLYFSSKEDLFMAVTRRDCEEFLEELDTALKQTKDISGGLQIIARHHMLFYFDRKQHTKLFFRTPNNNPELVEYMAKFMALYAKKAADVLLAAGAGEPELLAQSYIGMLDRLKMDILFQPAFTREDALHRGRFAANLFIKGCLDGIPGGQPGDLLETSEDNV